MCGLKQQGHGSEFPDVSYYPAALTGPSWSPVSPSLTAFRQKKEGGKDDQLIGHTTSPVVFTEQDSLSHGSLCD